MKERFLKETFEHQALIHKICRMYRDSKEDREDLFQEITYQLWKAYPNFQGRAKISTWMYRIGLNTAMATFRKPKIVHSEPYSDTEKINITEELSNDDNSEKILWAIKQMNEIESICWIGFLACYYNFFDGHLKPVHWNVLLVFAVGLLLVHNLLGYQVTNSPISGDNIAKSLLNYLKRIRKYAYLSISARVFAILIVFGYFLSGLESFESQHYWSLGGMGLIIISQFYFVANLVKTN